jgi:hypothetical protein
VNKRTLVPLALVALTALTITVAACGGGGGDQDKIAEVIEKAATTSDPGNCTKLQTQRFNEQNTEQKGKAAIKACEEEAEAGEDQAEGAKVSHVSANGDKATAQVAFEGGSLGSQALEVALVQENGDWKLDQVEGFANYDGQALGEAFEKEFNQNPEGLSKQQAACIAQKIAGASQAEAEELFFSGSPEPIIQLAEGCA